MHVRYHVFESTSKSWEALAADAAAFAQTVGATNLINISMAVHGNVIGANGVIIVWYWR